MAERNRKGKIRRLGKAAPGTHLELSRALNRTVTKLRKFCLLWSHNFKIKREDTRVYRRSDDRFPVFLYFLFF